MVEFIYERKKKKKKLKIYLILFSLFVVVNSTSFIIRGEYPRALSSFMLFSIVFYFSLKEKYWAALIVKGMVWLYAIVLVIMIVVLLLQ
ncbi:hypothetical protein [Alkalihalophilus marmarensis]|uniref:hypothetical protein n=1 Tax=Alkalihalophilus marmarensis TaxID=521377 RepID=UPI002DBDA361|nr:hypothetical protein [Alkalihalophilus marmarensis]MEC2074116.1 hypothetical protein [Alkalihalophilus marmarensis]